MTPATVTETTTYEHVLAQFHALSDEERQQFLQHLGQEQFILPRTGNSNGTAPTQQSRNGNMVPLRDDIQANPLYTHSNSLIKTLTLATEKNDTRTFIDFVREMDWTQRTAEEFCYVIDLAFTLQLWSLGTDLAKQGIEQFPDHKKLQLAKWLFFPENPSRKSQKKRGPIKGLKESQDWLAKNAYKYRGKWIAVNQGKLLGATATYEEIDEIIIQSGDPESTLLQRVL